MAAIRVLIVEDNPTDQALLRSILRSTKLPVKTTWALTVEEAEDSLDQKNFSLVLADVSLASELTGFDLWSHCQEEFPDIPFVMTTGMDQHDCEKLAEPMGIAPLFFAKPYKAQDIRHTLSLLLKK